MLCYSKTRKRKYFLDTPPSKKAQGYEWSRHVYTHMDLQLRTTCFLINFLFTVIKAVGTILGLGGGGIFFITLIFQKDTILYISISVISNIVEIQKLQSVQNAAARLITHTKKYDHITPILKELHWLPVEERIIFKDLPLVKKILSNEAPLYWSDFVEFYVPGITNLRSTQSNVLILKRKDTKTTCKNYGWRDFRVFAPFLWDDLPVFIRQTESIDNFKKTLKDLSFC